MPAPIRRDKNSRYYSRLIVFKTRRSGVWLACGALMCIYFALIYANVQARGSWLVVLAPVTILGSLMVFVPPSEEWSYEPWQSRPQRYERHVRN